MIIIADAHIDDADDSGADFFQMLRLLEKTDQDLIFLGDIFDLWIALSRYEKDIHKKFLTWCRKQKPQRSIGFIEGNHEYFVAVERRDYFAWCTDLSAWRDRHGNLFCHGDQINRRDHNYLRFRRLVKNRFTQEVTRFFPWGPVLSEALKHHLTKTNLEFRKRLPEKSLAEFAEARFTDGVHTIFVGHFHRPYLYRGAGGKTLYTLPAWHRTRQVTCYDSAAQRIDSRPWQELEGLPAGPAGKRRELQKGGLRADEQNHYYG